SRTQTNTGRHRQAKRMKRILHGSPRACFENGWGGRLARPGRRPADRSSRAQRWEKAVRIGPNSRSSSVRRVARRNRRVACATSKPFFKHALRLFHVASLVLILRIDLLAGAAEDREDFGRFQSRVNRLERAIERQRGKLGIPGLAIVVVNDDRMIRTKGFGYRDIEK